MLYPELLFSFASLPDTVFKVMAVAGTETNDTLDAARGSDTIEEGQQRELSFLYRGALGLL